MYRLSFIIVLLLGYVGSASAQNPHGNGMILECKYCHNPGSWSVDLQNIAFSHDTVGFKLEGRHEQTACKDCHTTLVFEEVGNECIDCHTDVHSMSVGSDCVSCHNSENWLVTNIPELHEQNGFPLLGQHRIADCTDCHRDESELAWNRIGHECASCHLEDYMSASEPNHQVGGISTECTECHPPLAQDWTVENFHLSFPLENGHNIQDCNECHNGNDYGSASTECVSCHQDDFDATTQPDHQAAGFSTDCLECHSSLADSWGSDNFHITFPLEGGHNIQDCNECHNGNDYGSASPECVSCHQDDFDATTEPDHQAAGFSTDCLECHSSLADSWGSDNFHITFPLEGGHNIQDCNECHNGNDYGSASPECVSCHQDDFDATTEPDHQAAGFSTDCVECHSSLADSWGSDNFHITFPLEGGHNIQDCNECHNGNDYGSASPECVSCHQDDFDATTEPDHQAAGFSTDCVECHSSLADSWGSDNFHITFPLEGGHNIQDCNECHNGNDYGSASAECVSCHQDDFDATTEPDHQAAGFSTDCAECHSSLADSWGSDNFHITFPLEGGHNIQDCNECHNGNDYGSASPECVSCHQDDFDATTEPDHQAAGFSTDCLECHSSLADSWGSDNFHLSFPLEGGHNIQDCNECHNGNDYGSASAECVSCHQEDFDATTEPDHQAAGFSTDCLECHSSLADSWGSDNFHITFPLEGGHNIQDCNECHNGNDYGSASPECVSCHQDDFDATTEPDHQAAGFSTDCVECHSSLADSWGSDNFHITFPLEGGHNIQDCNECHNGNDYGSASAECVSCHQDDFDATTEPDHQAAGFSTDCAECHSSLADSWGSDNFHLSFPLEGGHNIQDCNECHNGNDYGSASPECVSCHQDDFDATTEPDHQAAGFSTDCVECHSSLADSWGSDNFHITFPLEGGHNIQDCNECHNGNDYGSASPECVSCHQDDFDATTEPDHQAAGFSTDCVECHSSLADSWGSDNFHITFPLEGGHNIQDCNECHNGNDYGSASPECVSCHQDDFDATTEPDHQAAGFSTDCAECHSSLADSWGSDNFHITFPLEGGHNIQDCNECHIGNDYGSASPECVSCHQDDFDATTEPDHQAAGFSTDCVECHSSLADSWGSDNFHLSFPLEGGHNIQDCNECHNGNDYGSASPECVSCHQDDFDATTEPDHQAAGFSTDCVECHSSLADSWGSDNFHITFPLEGGHNIQDCNECHNGNDYGSASAECVSCHQDDFDATTEPDHQAAGFSTDCVECHSSLADSWGSDNFHITFPLEGGHNIQDCNECHNGNDYGSASAECVSCHQDDFDATTEPDHQAAGFSTDCVECHSSLADSWGSDNFHLSFPLEGGHNIQDCNECHNGNDYGSASPECVSCHQDDFDATTEPDHQAAGFSTDCVECHSSLADSWGSDNFHLSFPLEGGHNIQDCNECHNGNDYGSASPECVSCHQDDFDATTEPDHQAAGFSTDCVECHSSLADSWGSDNFHLSFPLEGGHNIQDCNECHNGNDYGSASPECVSCHQDDFDATTEPDHQAAGFSTDCVECHSSLADSWGSDNFHITFPLEGGHNIQDCNECHNGNDYGSASPECVSCHQDDFDATTEPDHQAAGFSTDCLECHSSLADSWGSDNFHITFPLEGGHNIQDCNECHNGNDYGSASPECVSCHQDDFDATTEPDHQAAGFSTDCVECHSSLADSWGSDNFHITFPLEGGHNIQDCNECHNGNDYGSASPECVSCHQDDFDATTEPDHQAAGFSTDCLECHSSLADSWGSDNFHITFPLEGGHNIQDCNECHNGNDYGSASAECVSCHQDDFDATIEPDHQAAGFSTDCLECHSSLADSWGSDNFHITFPLEGGHNIQDCNECHNGNDYGSASPECVSCHQDDFDATTEPDHQAAGFSTDCVECHSSLADSWGSDNFHLSFPLEGGHNIQDCNECHNGNDYGSASPECVSCHQDDFDATTEPDHQAAGFSTDCVECHSSLADSWGSDNFHITFPLEGGHNIQDCNECHNGNDYGSASAECVSCHQDDFDATTEPDHQAAGFSTDCLECHSSLADSWGSDNFHITFPLEGGHNIQDCNECHNGNDYGSASPECVSCHQDDFDATTEPDHQAAGFSTDCVECHSSLADSWGSDNFHITFPLEGGHNIQDCNECHNGNDYGSASPECVSCHQDDFNNANSPDHLDAGFSTNCLDCHTTNNWDSAILDQHDGLYFQIFTGTHDNEWNSCSDCHTTPGNYSFFSCIDCHQHDDPTEMADIHDEDDIMGYVYESNACYSCHPTGSD